MSARVTEYLDRIEIDHIEKPSLSFLQTLQYRHLLCVPFENLDIIRGREIILDERLIPKKIVSRHRGGFCYELNGAFGWLLSNLGFSVSTLSARVYDQVNDRFGPEFDHMVLLVQLQELYLVDVGVGDSFRKPIAVPEGEVKDISGTYRIHQSEGETNEYMLEKKQKDRWRPEYIFTLRPRVISDFSEMCIYHQNSPESPFTKGPFCTIATERGRLTLSTNSLTVTEWGAKRKIPISSPEEYSTMLREHFKIELEAT